MPPTWKPPPVAGKYKVGQTVYWRGEAGNYRGIMDGPDGSPMAVVVFDSHQASVPLAELRLALAPMNTPSAARKTRAERPTSSTPSTYLGALL